MGSSAGKAPPAAAAAAAMPPAPPLHSSLPAAALLSSTHGDPLLIQSDIAQCRDPWALGHRRLTTTTSTTSTWPAHVQHHISTTTLDLKSVGNRW